MNFRRVCGALPKRRYACAATHGVHSRDGSCVSAKRHPTVEICLAAIGDEIMPAAAERTTDERQSGVSHRLARHADDNKPGFQLAREHTAFAQRHGAPVSDPAWTNRITGMCRAGGRRSKRAIHTFDPLLEFAAPLFQITP